MSLFELAAATMRSGELRVDAAARNTTNTETPGFKAEIAFTEGEVSQPGSPFQASLPTTTVQREDRQGTLFDTGSSLDLAINGAGYFLVRDGQSFSLTRGGQFGLSAQGAIINAQGQVLQLSGGGDATTSNFSVEILPDGTMLDGNDPIGQIGVFQPASDAPLGTLSADDIAGLDASDSSVVHQAMLERSNVVLSDEIVELMQAQRQLESGAQLVRAYDRLMDRAISTFSRSG